MLDSSTMVTDISRMAFDIGLDQPSPAYCDERERLNRTRTWLNCFCVDVSYATQFGKMPMISLKDHNARHSREWYKGSLVNLPFDIHLCSYTDILLLFAEYRTTACAKGNERGNKVHETS